MLPLRFFGSACWLACAFTPVQAADWTQWRGPLQTGVSLEKYEKHLLPEKPLWTSPLPAQGTPLIVDGKLYILGYRGEFDDLVETMTCLDAATGKLIWEKQFRDFISDTAYNRYAIGSPAYDAETKQLYLQTTNGVFICFDAATGDIKWSHSLMEGVGRLTFPNGRTGAPVVEGDTVIVHCITANWGAAGPANDRFYAFDKRSGELVWFTSGGLQPKDSSHSTPFIETRYGRRVMYSGTGDGNLYAFNARTGEPLFRFHLSKMGVGCSPVIAHNTVMGIHADENVDNSEIGRFVGVRLPKEVPPRQADPTKTDGTPLPASAESWRHPFSSFTASATVVGDRVYQIAQTGQLICVDIKTGDLVFEKKIAESSLHSSPLYVDGYLYCPVKGGAREGGGVASFLHVFKLTPEGADAVQTVEMDGECNAQPAVANGLLYIATRIQLYCFDIADGAITAEAAPKTEVPKPGPAAALRVIPQEVVLAPGGKASFRIQTVDANGLVVGDAGPVKWESYIPPTARVKATADAAFNAAGEMVAGKQISAGAFRATAANGLTGVIRCRVMPASAQTEDFESFEIAQVHPTEPATTFAFPPLPWMGARFKWEVRDWVDPNDPTKKSKALAKTLDQIFFQRAMTFIGTEAARNYTLQADMLTDGSRRLKSEVGLVNQRYLITLKGNENSISISSNYERFNVHTPFPVKANVWYVLKTRVDHQPDKSSIIRVKAWERGQPEPTAWSFEHAHVNGHDHGAPGVFGFSPQVQKRVFIDNIIVTPND
ncbi:MAG: PQQ-binding-like beta-propeller repeat protein [Verrucomicrobiales bacterium]